MSTTNTTAPIKVTAIGEGYSGNVVRKPGEEFMIASVEQFSPRWMTTTDPRVSAHLTSKAAAEAAVIKDASK